jgi:hypothetical protein
VSIWWEDVSDNPGFWWRLGVIFTAADGTYNVSGLPDGNYRVQFTDPLGDFNTEYYDDTLKFSDATTFPLFGDDAFVADAQLDPIQASTGNIAGSTFYSGTARAILPLSNVFVAAYDLEGTEWILKGSDTSNASGEYFIAGLSPASYRIFYFPLSGDPDTGEALSAEYYDDVHTTIDDADDITVTAGITLTLADVILDPPPETIVEVVIEGDAGNVVTDPSTGETFVNLPPAEDPTQIPDVTITTDLSCPLGLQPVDVTLVLVPDDGSPELSWPMTEDPPGSLMFVGVIPGEEAVDGELWVNFFCGDVEQPRKKIGGVSLFDPSGVVTDSVTGLPVEGASVSLYRIDGWRAQKDPSEIGLPFTCQSNNSKDPEDPWTQEVPEGQGRFVLAAEQTFNPPVNPEFTDTDGSYSWAVATGCCYVKVFAPGYHPLTSPVVGVPPEVTDLHLELTPIIEVFLPIITR